MTAAVDASGPESPESRPASPLNADANADAPSSEAFNPETGEINWACPCLGGMADGPCGEEFKAAFSCFVYSTAEPKGVDCVEAFQAMQTCFREHPDVYAAELRDDDEESEEGEESEEDDVEGWDILGEDIGAKSSSDDAPR